MFARTRVARGKFRLHAHYFDANGLAAVPPTTSSRLLKPPPQVAIVAFGRVVERPWVVAGNVHARRVLTATLSADHRATDGREAGLFLGAVDRALQSPESL